MQEFLPMMKIAYQHFTAALKRSSEVFWRCRRDQEFLDESAQRRGEVLVGIFIIGKNSCICVSECNDASAGEGRRRR